MENQQEIGGAQALLQLGSKNRDEEREAKQGESEASLNISNGDLDIHDKDGHPIEDVAEHGTTEDHDAEGDFGDAKTNQQINDAVEAAVMRYVGGTLDDTGEGSANGSKKNKRKLQQDDIMSNIHDFNQWTGFLDADIAGNNQDFNSFATPQNQQQNTQSLQYLNKMKKKPKILPQPHNEIDPELTGISSMPDNDLLVQDAMLDPRELAKHLGNGSLQDLDFSATLNNMPPHQAQQVLLAASNAAQSHTNGLEPSAVINQLMHAASSAQTKRERKAQKPTKPEEIMGYQEVRTSPTDLKKHKFNHLTSIDSLIEEASAQACNWFNSLPENATKGPRLFSPEEIQAVDHFINGYCHIHKLSREDICHRIWSNDRKKDNFWESLTRILPYRSRASVYKHVRRQYHVFEVRAKWDKKDDEILRSLASTKEGNWKEIGDAMGRMPEDCRDRWRNYVKCGDNRVLNKWSEEEERKLKDIVSDMLENSNAENKRKGNAINWTVVSERMDGIRSRIQCRYKWNKLIKRSSAQKASFMDTETRLWLLQKIQRLGFPSVDNIDWNYLLHLYMEEHKGLPHSGGRFGDKLIDISASDFKMTLEKLVSDRKDLAKMSLPQLLDHLINDLYIEHDLVPTATQNGAQGAHSHPSSLPLHRQDVSSPSNYATADRHVQEQPMPDDDATSIANAAVAAVSVGVNGDDPQTHEYNLWR